MHPELKARTKAFAEHHDKPNIGRPLEELVKTTDLLRGYESQRLRTFCTSECMEPSRDLDPYGLLLLYGNLSMVKQDYLERLSLENGSPEVAQEAVAQRLYALRWGPTRVPLYNLLGLFMIITPTNRTKYLEIARFFIDTVHVPVTGTDLSGTTALSHSFSTKPGLDFEYAAMLCDAGGDVNSRNRFGGTVGHEIVQVFDFHNKEVVADAKRAFEWFLAHGGNVDIADTDGCSVRSSTRSMKSLLGDFLKIAEKEDRRRAAKGDACCRACGREDKKLLFCGRCGKVKYCQPMGRVCQKVDWPRHKKECKARGAA